MLAIGVSCMAADATNANTQPAEGPAHAVYWLLHWINVNRLDAAAALFADDAIVIVDPACPAQAPCIGRAAIRDRYLTRIARQAAEQPLVDQRLDGATLYAHDARSYRRMATGEAASSERYAFAMRDGVITALTLRVS